MTPQQSAHHVEMWIGPYQALRGLDVVFLFKNVHSSDSLLGALVQMRLRKYQISQSHGSNQASECLVSLFQETDKIECMSR